MHKYRIRVIYSEVSMREVYIIEKKHFFGWRRYEEYGWFTYELAQQRLDQILNG